ncbi:MAG: ABC transporter ATP-binding protein [Firmicutes bacterium]|nr:ABC transporter ATP-binding protein [Bacillota bacterium]
MITLNNITRKYGDFYALKNIDLTIGKGDYIAICGRSGSGKTTLLNLVGGLDRPTNGDLIVKDINFNSSSDDQLAEFRNKNLGFVFQSFHLEPTYTVYKNIEIPLLIANADKKESKLKIEQVAEKLGITSKLKNIANTLSGGEKQRVAIARALINDPDIIIADEPCGNLDSKNSAAIMDILDTLSKEGKTIILVTHQESDAKRAKKIITLEDGQII